MLMMDGCGYVFFFCCEVCGFFVELFWWGRLVEMIVLLNCSVV